MTQNEVELAVQGADGVLAVVQRNFEDDQSVLLFLEDAGEASQSAQN